MKPIKFNLMIDGEVVRTLEDLKENFNIDDVYDLFEKKILQKWLLLKNETSIVEKLENIDDEDMKIVIDKLLTAFDFDTANLNKEIFSHIYMQSHQKEIATVLSEKKTYSQIVDRYYENYIDLKKALMKIEVVETQSATVHPQIEIPYSNSLLLGEPDSTLYRIAQRLLLDESEKSLQNPQTDENGLGDDSNSISFNFPKFMYSDNFESETESSDYQKFIEELEQAEQHNIKFTLSYYKRQRKNIESKYRYVLARESGSTVTANERLEHDHSMIGEIKAIIDEIEKNYINLFRLDFNNFFTDFIDRTPIVIMICLLNDKMRKILLDDQYIESRLKDSFKKLISEMSPFIQSYRGNTDGMWKNIGSSDKKYLVLSVSEGAARVGEQQNLQVDYDAKAINGNYLILEGLMFKSASKNQTVLYLEA